MVFFSLKTDKKIREMYNKKAVLQRLKTYIIDKERVMN